jgi:hypothetical protein
VGRQHAERAVIPLAARCHTTSSGTGNVKVCSRDESKYKPRSPPLRNDFGAARRRASGTRVSRIFGGGDTPAAFCVHGHFSLDLSATDNAVGAAHCRSQDCCFCSERRLIRECRPFLDLDLRNQLRDGSFLGLLLYGEGRISRNCILPQRCWFSFGSWLFHKFTAK